MTIAALFLISKLKSNQVISNTGFESPCSTKGKSCRFSPLETPLALCPPQEAGFTLNQIINEFISSWTSDIARHHSGRALPIAVNRPLPRWLPGPRYARNFKSQIYNLKSEICNPKGDVPAISQDSPLDRLMAPYL